MKEISNRTLAFLLVVAIIISIGGTITTLTQFKPNQQATGYAVDESSNATVTLTIVARTEVNWTTYEIDWGDGAVDVPTYSSCNLSTQGYNGSNDGGLYSLSGNGCDTNSFNSVTTGLILENVGNRNVTLNITSGSNATDFIGGTADGGPLYWFNVSDATEEGSCMGVDIDGEETGSALGLLPDVYENMNGNYTTMWMWPAGTGQVICNSTGGGLRFDDATDTIRFDLFVRIPSDAPAGSHTDTITAIIEAIS